MDGRGTVGSLGRLSLGIVVRHDARRGELPAELRYMGSGLRTRTATDISGLQRGLSAGLSSTATAGPAKQFPVLVAGALVVYHQGRWQGDALRDGTGAPDAAPELRTRCCQSGQ